MIILLSSPITVNDVKPTIGRCVNIYICIYICGSVSKPCTPSVHIKIAGKWMFIPLKIVLIGIDNTHIRYHRIPPILKAPNPELLRTCLGIFIIIIIINGIIIMHHNHNGIIIAIIP